MGKELKTGDVLRFHGDNFRLLPKLEVIFGGGTSAEEAPIKLQRQRKRTK